MTIDIRLIIALDPEIKALLSRASTSFEAAASAALAGAPIGNSDGPEPAPKEANVPAKATSAEPPPAKRGRGRPPKAAAAAPAPAPEPAPKPEPEPEEDPDPLANFNYPLEALTVRKLMVLLAHQTDRDEAVRTMVELAATAEKSFTFTNVSSMPASEIPYMIEGLLDVVDLNREDRLGHRLLSGEIDISDVMQP